MIKKDGNKMSAAIKMLKGKYFLRESSSTNSDLFII